MKHHYAITAMDGLQHGSIVTRSGISLIVPCISLTVANNGTLFGHWHLWKNSEMEHHYAIATIYIWQRNSIVTRSGVSLALPRVSFTMADSCTLLSYWHLWKNGQMEHHYAITTMDGLQRDGIVTRSGISLTVPCITLTMANSCALLNSYRTMDSQMEKCCVFATLIRGCHIGIITALSISSTIP